MTKTIPPLTSRDHDDDVDGADYGLFNQCFNGAGNPPACQPTDWKAMDLTWDGENRLIMADPIRKPAGAKRVLFDYDHQSRRIRKQVYTCDGNNGWTLTTDERFVYDGWNVVEVLDGLNENAVATKYTWGLDLSGLSGNATAAGVHGAGGIGGLLACEEVGATSSTSYWYLYDGNGNVGQVITAANQEIAARYEYDPYGNPIAAVDANSSGFVDRNPFRFSTKWFDGELGTYYYGYRYYSPRLGRWLSRDPIGERGGLNLHEAARNQLPGRVDPLGLAHCSTNICVPDADERMEGQPIFCFAAFLSGIQIDYDMSDYAESIFLDDPYKFVDGAINNAVNSALKRARNLKCTTPGTAQASVCVGIPQSYGQAAGPWQTTIQQYTFSGVAICKLRKSCTCCSTGGEKLEYSADCEIVLQGWDTYDFHDPLLSKLTRWGSYRMVWTWRTQRKAKGSDECMTSTSRPSQAGSVGR